MMSQFFRDYLELTKPRILSMQLVTLGLGFFLASSGHMQWGLFCIAAFGTALVSAGAGALNHVLEVTFDANMDRTKNRPIVTGRVSRTAGLIFGLIMVLSGLFVLGVFVNFLVGFLSFLTVALYVGVYTPMKRVSWLNTLVGAVPGAIPPLGGWVAVRGHLSVEAWVLFLILFIWQLPHFYAIAWIFKADYTRAKFKMLSVIDDTGTRTARQIILQTLVLMVVSLFPLSIGMLGPVYAIGAMGIGGYFLKSGFRFSRSKSIADARLVLRASVIYLPVLLLMMVLDRWVAAWL